jgi:hypothetical protein
VDVDHSSQKPSISRTPSEILFICLQSHNATAGEVSSHCSRLSAQIVKTSFHIPSDAFSFCHFNRFRQGNGVATTKVVSLGLSSRGLDDLFL